MTHSKVFLRTRDIDWAVKIGKDYIHVASAGGDLPKIVDDNLFKIWQELKKTRGLIDGGDVIVKEEYISEKYAEFREVNADEADFRIQWYICSFVEMASRGFYSFDRDVRTPFEDSKYRLVASPGQMRIMPEYNLPVVDLELEPIELDGRDIVRLIDERTEEN